MHYRLQCISSLSNFNTMRNIISMTSVKVCVTNTPILLANDSPWRHKWSGCEFKRKLSKHIISLFVFRSRGARSCSWRSAYLQSSVPNTPACNDQVLLKMLISWFSCVIKVAGTGLGTPGLDQYGFWNTTTLFYSDKTCYSNVSLQTKVA